MSKYIEAVKEFHEAFEHEVNSIGGEHLSTRQRRIKLLFEELKELAEASDCKHTLEKECLGFCEVSEDVHFPIFDDGNNVNHVEELDALCDLQYVLSGKILTGGYHNVFDAAFEEVHNSNMSKACESAISAQATLEDYQQKGVVCNAIERLGKYIIKREDGKVLKSIRYTPANLDRFVNGYE